MIPPETLRSWVPAPGHCKRAASGPDWKQARFGAWDSVALALSRDVLGDSVHLRCKRDQYV